MLSTADEVIAWIYAHLFVRAEDSSYFMPRARVDVFGDRLVMLSTPIGELSPETLAARSSLLPGGSSLAAIDRMLAVVAAEPVWMFRILDPDNCLSMIDTVERFDGRADPVAHLAAAPAAQGGDSYVGLLAASQRWMLLHAWCPGNHITIAMHGSRALCAELRAAGFEDVRDLDD